MNSPFFSIIIAVYNAHKTLCSTVRSVLDQSFKDWELVLVDDCSSDDSFVIAQEQSKEDLRIHAYKMENNTGNAKMPLDFGMKKAKGEYCLMIGHDDILLPDYLSIVAKRIEETKADAIVTKMIIKDEKTGRIMGELPKNEVDSSKVLDGKTACLLTIPDWMIGTNGMAFKRELYEFVYAYNPSHYMNSDEFSSRILLYYANAVAFCSAEYIYYQISTSITHKASPKLFEQLYVDEDVCQFIRKRYGLEVCKSFREKMFVNLQSLQKRYFASRGAYSIEQKRFINNAIAHGYENMHNQKWDNKRNRILASSILVFKVYCGLSYIKNKGKN